MAQDILPFISNQIPITLLDTILALLTHRSGLIRRTAFTVVLGSYGYLLYFVFFHSSGKISKNSDRDGELQTRLDLEYAEASNYVPLPPTPQQLLNYDRISRVISSSQSAFSPQLFTGEALGKTNSAVVGVTAVVLHWKRRKGLELVLSQLAKYPFIREVIIWNNRGGIDLVPGVSTVHFNPDTFLLLPY